MTHLDKFIKNTEKCVLYVGHGVLIIHTSIFFKHFDNKKGIFELIVYRLASLILNDGLNRSERSCRKVGQEKFVVFYSSIYEITNNIAEESGIGLTKFFNVKLITIEGLNLFIIFLSHNFAKFMQENILCLTYRLRLCPNKFSDSNTLIPTFRKT